jgi:uncharacterized protein YdcH (DUF465 family)
MNPPADARDRLLREDASFRRLARKHEEYERRLDELAGKRFPTEEEQREESTLKKQKLAVKDEMERMLRSRKE